MKGAYGISSTKMPQEPTSRGGGHTKYRATQNIVTLERLNPMENDRKETVIIVHGTFAAPKPEKTSWYQPADGDLPAGEFVTKLDEALKQRGSYARCWAHCANVKPSFFCWTGNNSWVARTSAARELGQYVTTLHREGWRCHIIAHSHGGNIVAEAFPNGLATSAGLHQSKIVTLGTPFISTSLSIKNKSEELRRSANGNIFGIVILWFIILFALAYSPSHAIPSWLFNSFSSIVMLASMIYGIISMKNERIDLRSKNKNEDIERFILCINSNFDEAWQVLHHLRDAKNPLRPQEGILKYIAGAWRYNVFRKRYLEYMLGGKSYSDLPITLAVFIVILQALTLAILFIITFFPLFAPYYILPDYLVITLYSLLFIQTINMIAAGSAGPDVLSVYGLPLRWLIRIISSLTVIPYSLMSYIVRRAGWSFLQKSAMGLEYYPFELPEVEQCPSDLPSDLVTYESMPENAERRALNHRNDWIKAHLGGATETFARLTVTAADINGLLETIMEDQSLVHGAYYTDDVCIARIADWISDCG